MRVASRCSADRCVAASYAIWRAVLCLAILASDRRCSVRQQPERLRRACPGSSRFSALRHSSVFFPFLYSCTPRRPNHVQHGFDITIGANPYLPALAYRRICLVNRPGTCLTGNSQAEVAAVAVRSLLQHCHPHGLKTARSPACSRLAKYALRGHFLVDISKFFYRHSRVLDSNANLPRADNLLSRRTILSTLRRECWSTPLPTKERFI